MPSFPMAGYGLKFLCECVNDIQYLWPPCIGVCVKEVELVQGVLGITRQLTQQSSEVRDTRCGVLCSAVQLNG